MAVQNTRAWSQSDEDAHRQRLIEQLVQRPGQSAQRIAPEENSLPSSTGPGFATISDSQSVLFQEQGDSQLQQGVVQPARLALLQEDAPIQQDLDQVPTPPQTGDRNRTVGPPLQVLSNAMSEALVRKRRRPSWCTVGPPFRVLGCTPGGMCAGGFAQFGYHTDDTILFNQHDDQLLAQQMWFWVGKRAEHCCDWDIGYHLDLVYGADGPDIQAFGNPPVGDPAAWDNDWDHGIYGWAVPQAYVEVARDRLTLRGGKFFQPWRYEQIPAVQNFFYSRSYTSVLTEPYSFTGALAEFRVDRCTTLFAGGAAGWDTGFRRALSGANAIGGVRSKVSDNATLTYSFSAGDTGYRGSGYWHTLYAEVGGKDQALRYVLLSDYLDLQGNEEYSIVNYLFYWPHECLGVGSRLEWYRSDQFTGTLKSTWEWTTGVNIKPNPNIVVRPEVRLDWGRGAVDNGQFILGVDAILTF